jgi:hypothetical protein
MRLELKTINQCEIVELTTKDLEEEKKYLAREKINIERRNERKAKPIKQNEVKYIVKVKNHLSSKRYYLVGRINPDEKDIIVASDPKDALTFDSALNLSYHFHNFNFEFEIVIQQFPENRIDFELICNDEEYNNQNDEDSTDYEREVMRAIRNGDGDLLGY